MLYEVWANHLDRREFIAIAEGDAADILAFFEKKKCYGLILEEIRIVKVPAGTAKRVEEIKKRQAELDREKSELAEEIRKNSC